MEGGGEPHDGVPSVAQTSRMEEPKTTIREECAGAGTGSGTQEPTMVPGEESKAYEEYAANFEGEEEASGEDPDAMAPEPPHEETAESPPIGLAGTASQIEQHIRIRHSLCNIVLNEQRAHQSQDASRKKQRPKARLAQVKDPPDHQLLSL